MPTQTIIGIDYGLKQIGIAVLSRPIDIATPLTVIHCRKNKPDWQALEDILREWQPSRCIIGLPLNMDGSESDFSRQCRRFAAKLEGRLGNGHGFTVELQDERLSSMEAKQLLAENPVTSGSKPGDYKARPADSLAAKIILESWLEHSN